MEQQAIHGAPLVHPAGGDRTVASAATRSEPCASEGSELRALPSASTALAKGCDHRCLTAFVGTGWICAECRVPVLALSLPIPLPLIAQAIKAVCPRSY